MDRILVKLRQHSSSTPSRWREVSENRQANLSWLKQSREIAIRLLSVMRHNEMTQTDLSNITGLDENCIQRLLRGKDKVEAEILSTLEKTLSIDLSF